MKLFNRKTKISNEVIARKIAAGIINYQQRIADYLNQRTKSWTPKFRVYLTIGGCLLIGMYFLSVLVNALNNL